MQENNSVAACRTEQRHITHHGRGKLWPAQKRSSSNVCHHSGHSSSLSGSSCLELCRRGQNLIAFGRFPAGSSPRSALSSPHGSPLLQWSCNNPINSIINSKVNQSVGISEYYHCWLFFCVIAGEANSSRSRGEHYTAQ